MTAVMTMIRSRNAMRTAIIAGLEGLYMCSIFSLSTIGGRRVSISSGGRVTGSMPQKSSLGGSEVECNRQYWHFVIPYLIVSGVAWMLLSGSSWKSSLRGMISSNL